MCVCVCVCVSVCERERLSNIWGKRVSCNIYRTEFIYPRLGFYLHDSIVMEICLDINVNS